MLGGLGHILNDEQPSSRENSSAGLTEREGEVLEQCLNIRGTFCFLQTLKRYGDRSLLCTFDKNVSLFFGASLNSTEKLFG